MIPFQVDVFVNPRVCLLVCRLTDSGMIGTSDSHIRCHGICSWKTVSLSLAMLHKVVPDVLALIERTEPLSRGSALALNRSGHRLLEEESPLGYDRLPHYEEIHNQKIVAMGHWFYVWTSVYLGGACLTYS